MAQREPHIRLMSGLAGDEPIRVRCGHRSACGGRGASGGSQTDARVFRKERLPKAERDKGNIPRFLGQKRHSRFWRVYSYPFLKRILRVQQIVVIKINFISAPAEVATKIVSQCAFGGDVRCERSDGDVVSIHWSKRAVVGWVAGIEEPILVEIIPPRRFARIVKACQQRQILGNLVHIVRAPSRNRTELALPDEALSKI